jgi:hypothetical protein
LVTEQNGSLVLYDRNTCIGLGLVLGLRSSSSRNPCELVHAQDDNERATGQLIMKKSIKNMHLVLYIILRICVVMVDILAAAASAVDCENEPPPLGQIKKTIKLVVSLSHRSGQIKIYKISRQFEPQVGSNQKL